MQQELIKPIVKVGNSAGVILPKEWLNGKAKIQLVEKPLNIKKDIFEILEPYLHDVLGIYLVGSYARREETKKSDVDVIVISNSINKNIISNKYDIQMISLESAQKTLKIHPIMLYPRLCEADTILNDSLLKDFKDIKLTKKSFKLFYEDSKRVIKINKELVNLDRIDGDILQSNGIIYSCFLRLRGVYMINQILKKKKYSKTDFKEWLIKKMRIKERDFNKIYLIYGNIKDSKLVKEKISINIAERLLKFLEKEVKRE